MQKSVIILSLLFIVTIAACTKGPGTGGRASIKGKVYARNYSNNPFVLSDSGYVGGEKVYLKYGDQNGVGDDVDTDYEGNFLFPYLRPGEYTVFVYTSKLIKNTLDSAIIQKVTISDRKQEVVLPQFDIITLKN